MEKIPEKFLNKDGTLNSDALIKSYTELEKKIGTMVSVPDSADDVNATKKFRRAIGVPETAAEYPATGLPQPCATRFPGCVPSPIPA